MPVESGSSNDFRAGQSRSREARLCEAPLFGMSRRVHVGKVMSVNRSSEAYI